MKRHWSFIVCDIKFWLFFIILIISVGVLLSVILKDEIILNRFGNFIMAIGVWISMRDTFREGLNKNKDLNDEKPILHGGLVNMVFFNKLGFTIGDAKLKVWGFFFVIIGSITGSFGDLIIKFFVSLFK